MKNVSHLNFKMIFYIVFCSLLIAMIGKQDASAHGGKTHEDNSFTTLQALQKATDLYDKLISDGKLDESWETQLVDIAIRARRKEGKDEVVVSFRRGEGTPATVFIFFTTAGEYAGSNFTGPKGIYRPGRPFFRITG